MISRRSIMLRAASILPLVAIAACSSTTTPSQAESDINLIANGLSGVVAALAAVPGVPASTLNAVKVAINDVMTNAAALANTISPPSTNTVAQNISGAVNVLATIATPFFPLAPLIGGVINAAIVVINSVLGIVKPGASMTLDEARLVLTRGV